MRFIIGRGISGIGAAGITTGSMRIIAFAVPRHHRPYVEGGCAAILGELNFMLAKAGPLADVKNIRSIHHERSYCRRSNCKQR